MKAEVSFSVYVIGRNVSVFTVRVDESTFRCSVKVVSQKGNI